jgi:polysaccharide export outer membrane protein
MNFSLFSTNENSHLVSSSRLIKLFALVSFMFINGIAFGQKATPKVDELTDEQVQAFFQKAQASGLSENQIEKAAMAQGFTASDIAKMRERLNKLSTVNTVVKETNTGKRITNRYKTSVKVKDSTDSSTTESPSDEANSPAQPKVFGASLFREQSISFEPDLRIATPKNYQLGPDDELNVDIFGNALDSYKMKVSPEGTVRILNLSPIYVNGLTIEAASERIIGRLRQLYQGLNSPGSGVSAQVTLGNVRSIKVTLTGEVSKPGTYTVSSLATVFNALYLAGGPSENGSFRNIKVIRDNKIVRVLDLYDFLLKADQKDNIRLHDQDIIRIADYTTRVEIAGEVKRPYIFEVEKEETLHDVLRFAGGFTDNAYTFTIGLKRHTAKELKLLNITQEEVASFIPKRGDKFNVGTILNRYENRVTIKGAVFRPGEYAIEPGVTTVKELVKKAEGVKEDAFLNRVILTRLTETNEPELITFNALQLLKGEIQDIPLKREDVINISSIMELREKRFVSIQGEVNKDGNFDFIEGMTVNDLILMAKGFKEGASINRLELSRRIKDDTLNIPHNQNVKIFTFTIDKNLIQNSPEQNMVLEPFDILIVRKSPRFEDQKRVSIDGEVNFPGVYTIKDKSQRISDLIQLSGGFKLSAAPQNAIFRRDSSIVAINMKSILKDPNHTSNILLLNGDALTIPRQAETIKLTGSLQNPVSVTYQEGFRVKDYISEAGGFKVNADKKHIYVKYANGISDHTKTTWFIRKHPQVEAGSEIIVPEKEEKKSQLTPAERIGILGGLSSLTYILITIINSLK